MSKKHQIDYIREKLGYGKEQFDDAAEEMEKLGDKKGADTVRKHADDALKTVPSQDPKKN